MPARRLLSLLKWPLALGSLCGVCAVAYLIHDRSRADRDKHPEVQESRVHSLKTVTSQELIARDALDNAMVQLSQARTQLAVARAVAEELQKAKDATEDPTRKHSSTWKQPLTAPLGGQVVELAGA